jgi:RNA polymerase sigma factor (sigma-70 family)
LITGHLARLGAYQIRESWDDLCQEVLIALIQSVRRGAIREPKAFVSFTGTVTRNKLADWSRQAQKPGEPDEVGDPETAEAAHPSRKPGPEEAIQIDLKRALEALPEKLRQVIDAVYLQGHSYEAAAAQLGLPLGTMKRLRTEGLRELRRRMEASCARA